MSTAERSTPPPGPPSPRDVEHDEARFIRGELVEAFAITDDALIRRLKSRREKSPLAMRDEMWEGVYVMSPMAGLGHQRLVGRMTAAITPVVDQIRGGDVLPGVNISDRIADWQSNFRVPDIAVYFSINPAIIRDAFACGGPDLAVESLGEGDLARKKLDIYALVNTRGLLLLDRDPWALELYRLVEGRLVLVGISTPDRPESLASEVLPPTFRLVPGESRPTLELSRLDGGQVWRI